MKKFTSFMDLTKEGRTLDGGYYGKHNLNLEARIFTKEPEKKLKVGISLWDKDVAHSQYHESTNALDVFYDYSYQTEIRAGLHYTEFIVPDTIKKICVYDKDQI